MKVVHVWTGLQLLPPNPMSALTICLQEARDFGFQPSAYISPYFQDIIFNSSVKIHKLKQTESGK